MRQQTDAAVRIQRISRGFVGRRLKAVRRLEYYAELHTQASPPFPHPLALALAR